MKDEQKDFKALFEGDLTSLAVYWYLCSLLNGNARMRVSLSELAKKTGFSPKKTKAILSRLIEMGLIDASFRVGSGVEIQFNLEQVRQFVIALRQICSNLETFFPGSFQPMQFVTDIRQNYPDLTNFNGVTIPERSEGTQPHGAKRHESQSLSLSLGSQIETKLETTTKSRTPTRKPRTKAKTLKFSPEDLELGKLWHIYARREIKTAPYKSWSDKYFAEAVAKVKRSARLNHRQMESIYRFVKDDAFWAQNAISPASLLKTGKNGLRKVDNIISAIRAKSPVSSQLERQMTKTKEEKKHDEENSLVIQALKDLGI